MEMDQRALQDRVESLSLQFFDKPFLHQATFNKRLKTTGGRYHLKTHDLDFNPRLISDVDQAVFDGIIKHELCHYHLHRAGMGYRHADRDFKDLLKAVGGLRHTPRLASVEKERKHLIYQCQTCGVKIKRARRFNTNRYVCRNCHGKFELQSIE